MTLLTMNAAIVSAIREYEILLKNNIVFEKLQLNEPPLHNPQIGNPIAHQQLIALHDILRQYNPIDSDSMHLYRLGSLLHGSRIYAAPKAIETTKVVIK